MKYKIIADELHRQNLPQWVARMILPGLDALM
jgi:hypothetical protein